MAELKATRREVTGKKVNSLRRQGITPVHVYGPDVKPETLQCETNLLKRLLGEAGRTSLIDLRVTGEKASKRVLVREVQPQGRFVVLRGRHGLRRSVLQADDAGIAREKAGKTGSHPEDAVRVPFRATPVHRGTVTGQCARAQDGAR